jgi:hypothetical protein
MLYKSNTQYTSFLRRCHAQLGNTQLLMYYARWITDSIVQYFFKNHSPLPGQIYPCFMGPTVSSLGSPHFISDEMSLQIHEKCIRFWWGIPKERNYSKDRGIDGRMRSDWILGRLAGGVDWIKLPQNRDRWQALVNAVTNLLVLPPRSYLASTLCFIGVSQYDRGILQLYEPN